MLLIIGQTEDMWTPYKELYKSIETNLVRDTQVPSSELEQILRKYKQNFFNLLQNPVSAHYFDNFILCFEVMRLFLQLFF